MLTDGGANEARRVLRETQSIYWHCSIPHNGLVEAVRKAQP